MNRAAAATHIGCSLMLALLLLNAFPHPARAQQSKFVHPGPDGRLVYTPDENGDAIPDFSNCGYGGGGVRLPDAPTKLTLSPDPTTKDDTARIQAAIDELAKLPPDAHNLRGALLLKKGRYPVAGQLKIRVGGIILRGEGQGDDGTVLLATGTATRALIDIDGDAPKELPDTDSRITDPRVPVGARSFNVADPARFNVGDTVFVKRVGNAKWIHEIAMDRIVPRSTGGTRQWEPFTLAFDRVITAIDGHRVTVDAPIACAIEDRWGGGLLARYTDPGRVQNVGVENLRGDSEFDKSVTARRGDTTVFTDEKHARILVSIDAAKNCWIRDVTAIHFYHGVADVGRSAKWVTVQDSTALDPVSEITGGRRYPFSLEGQLTLVQRCHTRGARHAFVVGSRVCGPNVFLDCASEQDYATSEPHHRWSVGGLYDCVTAQVAVQDRGYMGSGHGWAGANYVVWNCEGSLVLQRPPTANNWSIGFVGKKSKPAFDRPDGTWESFGQHVHPRSLYLQQLEDRMGKYAVTNTGRS